MVWRPPHGGIRDGNHQAARALRGTDAPFEIMMEPVPSPPTLDDIRRFRDAGVDRLTFMPKVLAGGQKTLQASLDGLSRFAETVINRMDK
jgi:hypothetical protein